MHDESERDLTDAMAADKRRGRSSRSVAAAQEKRMRQFVAGLLRVIEAQDSRALTELLKLYEIPEGSEKWKRAWKVFYEASGQK